MRHSHFTDLSSVFPLKSGFSDLNYFGLHPLIGEFWSNVLITNQRTSGKGKRKRKEKKQGKKRKEGRENSEEDPRARKK